MYFNASLSFKTCEKKTSVDLGNIYEKIFSSLHFQVFTFSSIFKYFQVYKYFHSISHSTGHTIRLVHTVLDTQFVYKMNACDLLTSSKGKLKWEGDFNSLKRLFDEILDSSTEWTSPGGNNKKCECDGLILRWYPSSGSLTLNGDNADKVKAQLLQLMEAGYENVDDLSQDGGRMACDVEEEASMQNVEECDMDKNINHQIGIDLHSEPIQANPLGEISSSNT